MKKILLLSFFSAILILTSSLVNAQQWLWGRQGYTGIKSGTTAPSITADRYGDVWHVGTFVNTLTFGTYTLVSNSQDAFLVKYDKNGNILWAKQSMGTGKICWANFVASDDSGNTYITGDFKDTSLKFGSFTLTSPTFYAAFIVKYDKNGNVIWAEQSTTSSGTCAGTSVACDDLGYEYVTGNFSGGSVSFGASTVTSTKSAAFLVKYDNNGNVIWATQSTGTTDSTYANSVCTSRTGDEYVTGAFNGSPTFGTTMLYAHDYAIFLTKYDPNGNVLWAEQSQGSDRSINSTSYDESMSVSTDIYDDAYLTGFFADKLVFGSDTISYGTKVNMFYAKFKPNGNIDWLKQPTPLDGNGWYGFSVSTDINNHFYLSGETDKYHSIQPAGKIVFPPDTLIAAPSYYGGASVLVKFDSSGNALCGNIIPDWNESWSLNGEASDSLGYYVYLGGEFSDEDILIGDSLYKYHLGDLPYTARWIGCSNFSSKIVATPSTPCKYTCNGTATVTPIGGVSPYTYDWNTGQTTQTITGLCQGTYSVIVTDSIGYKSVQKVNVTSPGMSLTITHSLDSICIGGSVSFTASGLTSYNWFPANGLSCNTCPNPTATPTTTTTYYVYGQDTNTYGCIDTASITVLITPVPIITITNNISCSELLLTASGAQTYEWSPPSTLSCPSCSATYAIPPVTTTYTVIGNTNGCTDTTTITVAPAPITSMNLSVTAFYDTICIGDTAQLSGIGTGITSWIWTPTTDLSCSTCPNPMASPIVTTTYHLYGYDSLGCDTEVSITLKVLNHAAFITVLPNSICTGDSALLIAGGGSTYLWSTAQTSDSIWVTPASSTSYSVTATSKGCIVSTSALVDVNPLPVITVIPNDTICIGNSVGISASGASFYSWLPTTGLSCYNCPSPIATPTATTTYTVTGTSTEGCLGNNTVTVVVNPLPVAAIITLADTVCSGDSIMLIGGGGGSYLWSTSKTSDTIYVTPASVSTYTLIVSKNGCTDTTSKTIQIYTDTIALVSLSKDSICSGDSTQLTVSGATSFKWSNGATTSSIKIAPGSTVTYTVIAVGKCFTDSLIKTIHVVPTPVPVILGKTSVCAGKNDTLLASGGLTYLWSTGSSNTSVIINLVKDSSVTLDAFNGKCYKDTTIELTIAPSPTVSITPSSVICMDDSITLIATGGGSYYWSTGSTGSTITVTPTVTTTYFVIVTNTMGCSTTSNTKITIDIPGCFACCDTTILSGNNVVLYADSSYKYQWYPPAGISCDTCPAVMVSPTVTTTYTVLSTDKAGCEVARTITVIVEPSCSDFFIPNVFTPNGDGIDDEFEIKTENLSSWSIIIYDRWGIEMFKSNNPFVYWNGNTESGGPAPTGVYYYIIKSTCMGTEYNKDGFLQLIR